MAPRIATSTPSTSTKGSNENGRRDLGRGAHLLFLVFEILYNPCLLQGGIGTVLANGLQSFGRGGDGDLLADFRHEDGLLLEVDLAAALTSRVELCCTGTV